MKTGFKTWHLRLHLSLSLCCHGLWVRLYSVLYNDPLAMGGGGVIHEDNRENVTTYLSQCVFLLSCPCELSSTQYLKDQTVIFTQDNSWVKSTVCVHMPGLTARMTGHKKEISESCP